MPQEATFAGVTTVQLSGYNGCRQKRLLQTYRNRSLFKCDAAATEHDGIRYTNPEPKASPTPFATVI